MHTAMQAIIDEAQKPGLPNLNTILNYEEIEHDGEKKAAIEHTLLLLSKQAKQDFQTLLNTPDEECTIHTFLEPFLNIDSTLSMIYSALSHHTNVCNNETNNAIQERIQPLMIELNNLTSFSKPLYQKLQKLLQEESITPNQKRVIEKMIKEMELKGIALSDEKQEQLKKINKEQSQRGLNFQKNEIESEKLFTKLITDESEIAEMPQQDKDAAAQRAKEAEQEGWLFTLQAPSVMAIAEYCSNREIRKEFLTQFYQMATRAPHDNREIILKTLQGRQELAEIHNLSNFAEYMFQSKMADSAKQVREVILPLAEAGVQHAQKEREEIENFAQIKDFASWDLRYYSEKFKKEKLDFDPETVRPYFEYSNCLKGLYTTAEKVFGLTFEEMHDVESYHEDVRYFKVFQDGDCIAYFIQDVFARPGKGSGAWCNYMRPRIETEGQETQLPIVYNIANFGKAADNKPTLLKHSEVTTLFHEFGHATHVILSSKNYELLTGFGIEWDAVEVPSQLFEEFAWEAESLKQFAKHYETGEVISDELIEKINQDRTFMIGSYLCRQAQFILLDLNLHEAPAPKDIETLHSLSKEALSNFSVYTEIEPNYKYATFSHIFNGCYAAGYYSYIWADILVADIVAHVKEEGLFSDRIHQYTDIFLKQGATKKAGQLFLELMGREPNSDAYISQYGLK